MCEILKWLILLLLLCIAGISSYVIIISIKYFREMRLIDRKIKKLLKQQQNFQQIYPPYTSTTT